MVEDYVRVYMCQIQMTCFAWVLHILKTHARLLCSGDAVSVCWREGVSEKGGWGGGGGGGRERELNDLQIYVS